MKKRDKKRFEQNEQEFNRLVNRVNCLKEEVNDLKVTVEILSCKHTDIEIIQVDNLSLMKEEIITIRSRIPILPERYSYYKKCRKCLAHLGPATEKEFLKQELDKFQTNDDLEVRIIHPEKEKPIGKNKTGKDDNAEVKERRSGSERRKKNNKSVQAEKRTKTED